MIELFSNDTDFRKYVSVQVGFTEANLRSQYNEALEVFVFPYCSKEQFDISVISSVTKHTELMSYVKRAAANLGMYLYLPFAKVQISNAGIAYTADKTKQASAEDKQDLAESFRRTGLVAVQAMIEFLEVNEDVFTAWVASKSYSTHKALLIRNASEFAIINNSVQVFLALIPYIKDVEFDIIKSAIPKEILAKLYSRDFGEDEVKEAYKSLLEDYVQIIVRSFSMSKAIASFAVVKDKHGTLTVFDDTASGKSVGHKEAPNSKLQIWKSELEDTAKSRMTKMNEFIIGNAELFGLTTPTVAKTIPFRNPAKNGTAFF